VLPSAELIHVLELPTDLALSDDHDLFLSSRGDIATVSGVDALPQRLKTCLSHQKGESPFHHDAGTRLGEYYRLLSDSPWFEHFLKLELMRLVAIPYIDQISGTQNTPLLCIEQVFGIQLLADAPTNNWLPVRVDLQVKGLGRRQYDLSIYIPAELKAFPSIDGLLADPSGWPQDFPSARSSSGGPSLRSVTLLSQATEGACGVSAYVGDDRCRRQGVALRHIIMCAGGARVMSRLKRCLLVERRASGFFASRSSTEIAPRR
jgi:hypothetical protein